MKQYLPHLTMLVLVPLPFFSLNAQTGNTGVGTTAPTNRLHVVAPANPVRFVGIQPSDNTVAGTLVTDANGVIKMKTANTISALRVTGSFTIANNNTYYFNDITDAPTETFDNLGEFDGHTFTAAQPGLYQVNFNVNFDQRANTSDGGDGYMGYAQILAGTQTGSPLMAPQYSNTNTKVTLPEVSGALSYNSCNNTELVKLSAGEVIQFRMTSYGSTGNVTGNYVINISRID